MESYTLIIKSIILLPLISSLISGLFGNKLGKTFTHLQACLLLSGSTILSVYLLFLSVKTGDLKINETLYTWGVAGNLNFKIGYLLDQLSAIMLSTVCFISTLVHVYTIGYMAEDKSYSRFFCYISFFTFAMIVLVLADNFLQLFFGWEGVGFASYLLIGFWFKKSSATFASLKAFLINRVGDIAFVIGTAAVALYFNSIDYAVVTKNISNIPNNTITFICICLFIGAMSKSAQFPLHVWLPNSMEGPTPISALIHAATMVTAGVFMVVRLSDLFIASTVALNFILTIGAITCIMAAFLAIVQNDIKKIIAYSTISQLGYMVTALGASAFSIAIFHLVTHAFFKALLFLGAGSIIIALHHKQDIWQMGNLRKKMPITYATMLIGTLAIIGFPGFAGFYSKDLIIMSVNDAKTVSSTFAYFAVLATVFLTSFYSFRLLFVVFHGKNNLPVSINEVKESPKVVTIPLIILAIFSIASGALFIYFNLLNTSSFGVVKLLLHGIFSKVTFLALLGGFLAWYFYIKEPTMPNKIKNKIKIIYAILINKYGFDILYENIITKLARTVSIIASDLGDKLLIDGILVNGSAKVVGFSSKLIKKFQTGFLYNYIFTMLIGVFALSILFMWN